MTNYNEMKEKIIDVLWSNKDDGTLKLVVLLVPWASAERFNDMAVFSAIYSTRRGVEIRIRRQTWFEFIKYSIFGRR